MRSPRGVAGGETAAVHAAGVMLQAADSGSDVGPGLQAALNSFGNALDKFPTIQIRSPTMYSLVHSSTVRASSLHTVCSHAHSEPPLELVHPGPDISTARVPMLMQDESPLNLRASWLAGHPVRGNALLSKIRLRPHEWGQPCVRWGSYTLDLLQASYPHAPPEAPATHWRLT